MKKIVLSIILLLLTITTVQAQRLTFEPEIGFRLQHSEIGNVFQSQFVTGPAKIDSDYRKFWQISPNFSACLNTKIKSRWSFTSGFQYFNYRESIYHLENQPWPVGWKDKKLALIDRILGLKFGFRYDLFKKSEAKWGASLEMGIKYLIRQKTKFVLPEDTFASVSNGYNSNKVFFNSLEKQFPNHENGIINEYFTYLSIKPFYKINNRLNLIGSIDFNLNMDIIVISNFEAQTGHTMDVYYLSPSNQIPKNKEFSNYLMSFGYNKNSWNFSLGVQIPLIMDKAKKSKIDPAIMEGY